MPTLTQSLNNQDFGHLRIIAEHWGIELRALDARAGLPELAEALLDSALLNEIVAALSDDSKLALNTLLENDGQLPWPQFTRSFGELRSMGPGRRDRERPDRRPISPAEEIYYRALVARAFFDTASGAQEFAYIPDDLRTMIKIEVEKIKPAGIPSAQPQLGRAATAEERSHPIPADDRLLDHICTLLAAHRLRIDPSSQFPVLPDPEKSDTPDPLLSFATTLLKTANLLGVGGDPDLESARAHLVAARGESLTQLAHAWLHSQDHNDLYHVPYLHAEGEWQNDPLGTRHFLVGLLASIPQDTWWSISAFLADLHRDFPDFQRPASDYDSWFIRDTRSNTFLRGFEHWQDVDGALIRYLITGPLHWLGILDLAVPDDALRAEEASAFRHSKWSAIQIKTTDDLLRPEAPDNFPSEDAPIHVRSDGRINIPFLAPRTARYQIARFCQWEQPTSHEYRYRLTPGSLTHAIDQGLRIKHLQTLLARHAQNVPPNIVKALSRWDQRGTEARLQSALILRLGSPDLLKVLRNSRAARYLGDQLGPTTVIVKSGAGEKVLEVLTEMGHLGEIID
jgi:hypothetical protein